MSTNYAPINTTKLEIDEILKNNQVVNFEKLLDRIIDTDYSLICYRLGLCHRYMDTNNLIDILYSKLEKINNPSDIIVISVAYIHRVDLIKLVIDNGGNINACDKDGYTPLRSACSFGNYDVVEYLINNGASISHNGANIFKYLCISNYVKIFSLLFDHGMSIDFYDNDAIDGILSLIKTNNASFLNLLVSCGINFSPVQKYLKDKYESNKNNKVVEILLDLDFDPRHIYCIAH
ncbi:ankyrin repeat protein [Moumouvirus australiensis]|uniref:Ankyrin repeat protein n=1 Tax=Moumouvirus australiensis TaxID=2109587 RepID=A0A2P1EMI5_9VIRU|nr:ankyrin repeat protein [Moumouvirus australiensis]AVL95093.1 ankyrin repeat protein [Moumouvirus australiensis]